MTFPLPYLTYNGAPGKPKAGDRIVVKIAPVPLFKWTAKLLPGFKLRVLFIGLVLLWSGLPHDFETLNAPANAEFYF